MVSDNRWAKVVNIVNVVNLVDPLTKEKNNITLLLFFFESAYHCRFFGPSSIGPSFFGPFCGFVVLCFYNVLFVFAILF